MVFACFAAVSGVARAGGGPENVMLLVNANSDDSKAVANHYIELRKIPPSNVVYIDWRGGLEACQGIYFRDLILAPALKAVTERRLTQQIDYLVYSSDFPWLVDLRTLFGEDHKLPHQFRAIGSTTGLSYLAPFVLAKSPALVMPSVNGYVPNLNQQNLQSCRQLGVVPSRGFRALYQWEENGRRAAARARSPQYFLSTMLGVTRGRGNTVAEVQSYLDRAAAADGTRPQGTIYFMKNKDIRSAVRDTCYEEAAQQIVQTGVAARVVQGIIPRGARDIAGLMTGAERFDLAASQSTILPGAICEHLTSTGGVLRTGAAQTALSEFLRMGAAGASGTVVEPHAMQAKFPLPSLQLHYTRGCSLAEAFYQSVSGPYQLLIVGDPLCQPWAVIPQVTLEGVEPGAKVSGEISLAPAAVVTGARSVGLYEFFVDGRIVARSEPGKALKLDTTRLSDGYHELRVVAVSGNSIETRGRLIVPIEVDNKGAALELSVVAPDVPLAANLQISVRQAGATAIAIRHNGRELARVNGDDGSVEIAAVKIGRGAVVLQAFSEGDNPAASNPLTIHIQ